MCAPGTDAGGKRVRGEFHRGPAGAIVITPNGDFLESKPASAATVERSNRFAKLV